MKIRVVSRDAVTEREDCRELEGENLRWNFEDGRVDIYDKDDVILATFAREHVLRVERAKVVKGDEWS